MISQDGTQEEMDSEEITQKLPGDVDSQIVEYLMKVRRL